VSIGGTLTYEDVTNIDSVGIITAQSGLDVSSGGLDVTGIATFQTAVDSIGIVTARSGVHFGNVGSGVIINAVGAGTSLGFLVDGSERVRIDSSGRLLVGTSSTPPANTADVFIKGGTGSGGAGGLTITRTNSTPADNNSLGNIYFSDSNGTPAGWIHSQRDGGTWTSGSSQPSRLVFATTADGASSPTERMRITTKGVTKFTTNGSYQDATSGSYEFFHDKNNENGIVIRNSNGLFGATNVIITNSRAATSTYIFGAYYSSGFTDREFYFRGDGLAAADQSFNGGGADYAEYFEWSDGNPDDEDRRGISVVLDNDKIRPALAGEDPIGVISGNPSVVGDAAWNKWKGKHLRDDYGSYILDENGERQLNPDYDPDIEYINREDRPEWDCVGLMGKLRIRKGQPTGSRWIKMRDISDSVEEWLVR